MMLCDNCGFRDPVDGIMKTCSECSRPMFKIFPNPIVVVGKQKN